MERFARPEDRPTFDVLGLTDYLRGRIDAGWPMQDKTLGITDLSDVHIIHERVDAWAESAYSATLEVGNTHWGGVGRPTLGRAFHGVSWCPDRKYIFTNCAQAIKRYCQMDCALVYTDALQRVLWKLVRARTFGWLAQQNTNRSSHLSETGDRLRRGAVSKTGMTREVTSALRRHWTDLGFVAKPERAVEQAWVIEIQPREPVRKVLSDLLFLARTADPIHGELPWESLADRQGLSPVQCREQVLQNLDAMYEARPDWTERNLTKPLGTKLATSLEQVRA